MTFFNYLLITSFLTVQVEPGVIFSTKKKVHQSTRTIERQWILSLKRDATFSYTIIDDTVFKDKSVPKNDTTFFNGLWRYDGDTLFLYGNICPDNSKSEFKYLRKRKYLYSLGACIDSFGNQQIRKLRIGK